jgi:hypothetical protein
MKFLIKEGPFLETGSASCGKRFFNQTECFTFESRRRMRENVIRKWHHRFDDKGNRDGDDASSLKHEIHKSSSLREEARFADGCSNESIRD